MNRIFHARICWYQLLFLAINAVFVFLSLWFKYSIIALVLTILLIIIVEQIIHTEYVVTSNNRLQVNKGRFVRKIDIALNDIQSIKRCHSMKLGRYSITDYILIEYGGHRYLSLWPKKPEEFISLITKRKKSS